MITVNIYGLDQFLVGDLSVSLGRDLAKLYELDEDEINFVASNNMVFHAGVEQTSWRIFVEVNAPKKLEVLQKQATDVIVHHISQIAIHIEIIFKYYLGDHRYIHINEEYPLYLEEQPEVDVQTDYPDDIEEGEGEDEIYTGDIFEGLNH